MARQGDSPAGNRRPGLSQPWGETLAGEILLIPSRPVMLPGCSSKVERLGCGDGKALASAAVARSWAVYPARAFRAPKCRETVRLMGGRVAGRQRPKAAPCGVLGRCGQLRKGRCRPVGAASGCFLVWAHRLALHRRARRRRGRAAARPCRPLGQGRHHCVPALGFQYGVGG